MHSHFVGIAEHVGHAMTYKILTSDTKKVIFCSAVRPVTSEDRNIRAELGRKHNHPPSDLYDHDVLTPDSDCLLYTSPSPRDRTRSRMPSSA